MANPMDMTGGMRVPTTSMRRSSANRGFVIFASLSFFVHAALIVGVVYAQMLKPKTRPMLDSIPVELVRLGKPRDPKLLPRKTAPAVPPPDEGIALDTKNDPKPKAKPEPKKTKPKSEMSDAARRLLDSAADNRLDDALSKIDEVPEGSPDGDAMGTTTDASRAANAYQASISRTLKSGYALPQVIPASQRRFLVAEVILYIERDGTIFRYEFVKEHPNKAFMASVETLLKRTKLPPPPRNLATQYRETGVGVRFKP